MFQLERDDQTICALSTPPGMGGIGVVRICGPLSQEIIKKCISSLPDELESHRAYFGNFTWENSVIDEVVATYFKKGRSYTGEETIEVSCHGGPTIYAKILKALGDAGARPAERGEFTYRAFMNGRLDLIQAESVLSLIESESEKAAQLAIRQLKGELSKTIEELTDELTWVLAHLEANIDFAHEDIEVASDGELLKRLDMVEGKLNELVSSYKQGKLLKEGLSVAFVGRPNVGKSSLLNQILGENRAIVTDQPGTTRDYIESSLVINGIKVNLVDTAGLRETQDLIEQKGIERTHEILRESDLKVYLVDLSELPDSALEKEIHELPEEQRVIVGNKSDIKKWSLKDRFTGLQVEISALSKDKTKPFLEILEAKTKDVSQHDSAVICQARHFDLLKKAHQAVIKSSSEVKKKSSPEFIISELQEALFATHEILGRRFDDEVMDRVFKEFCLGK